VVAAFTAELAPVLHQLFNLLLQTHRTSHCCNKSFFSTL